MDSVIRSSNNRDLEETFRNNTIVLTFSTKKQKNKKTEKTNKQTNKKTDHVSIWGNCAPTHPLTQHYPRPVSVNYCWVMGGVGAQWFRS